MRTLAAVCAVLLAACATTYPDPATALRLQQSIRASYCALAASSGPQTAQYQQVAAQCAQLGIPGPESEARR